MDNQNGFIINVNGEITDYNGTESDVMIPVEIGGVKVRKIAFMVFDGKGLTSVVLPEGLEVIRECTFSYNKLSEITIPEGVETIYEYAFLENKLNHIDFPASLKKIHLGAFWDNELSEIVLPESLEEIECEAFIGNHLASITIGNEVVLGSYYYCTGEYIPSFDNGFDAFYNNNGKKAGRYLFDKESETWSVEEINFT